MIVDGEIDIQRQNAARELWLQWGRR